MKRVLGFLVAAVLAVVIVGKSDVVNAQTFKDVDSSEEYYEEVERLVELGSFSKAEKFNPSNEVTRGQLAKIMAITLNLDTENVKNPNFKDVPTTHQFYPYIAALVEAGIISGYNDGTYGINKKVTRGQMAKFIVKGFELKESKMLDRTFVDEVKSSEVFRNADTLAFYYITTAEKFNPSSTVKRSQIALFIGRALNAAKHAKNELRIPANELGFGNISANELFYYEDITRDLMLDVKLNELGQEIVLIPKEEGKVGYFFESEDIEKFGYLEIDIAEDFSMTYKKVNQLSTDYKSFVEYSYYADDSAIRNVYLKTLNVEPVKTHTVLLEDQPQFESITDFSFSADKPNELWQLDIEFMNGEKEQKFFYSVEDDTHVFLSEIEFNSTNRAIDEIESGYNELKLIKGNEQAVTINNSYDENIEKDLTVSIEFTALGTYVFDNIHNNYIVEVVQWNGKLGCFGRYVDK